MTAYFSDCFNGIWLTCGVEDGHVTALRFGRGEATPAPEADQAALWDRVRGELAEYFAGVRQAFDLPLRCAGTAFQKAVWAELLTISYGQTRSYGELAKRLGRPKAGRAVGQACHRNPIVILIPCHRVVGSTGALTGFAGGTDIKSALLELEGSSAEERKWKINL